MDNFEAEPSTEKNLNKYRVLIVEDNEALKISSVCLRKPCTTGYGYRKKA